MSAAVGSIRLMSAVVRLAASRSIPEVFLAVSEGDQATIVAGTRSTFEGAVLGGSATDAIRRATPPNDRLAKMHGSEIPATILNVPGVDASYMIGAEIIDPRGDSVGILAALGNKIGSPSDVEIARVENALAVLESRLDTDIQSQAMQTTGQLLKSSGDELRRWAEQLRAQNKTLDLFADYTAHEIKNPLRAIMLGVDFISYKLDTDPPDISRKEIQNILSEVSNEVSGLYNQISSLLELGRLQSTVEFNRPLDLNAVVARAVTAHQTSLDEVAATVTVAPLPTVLGDSEQVTTVFSNLISNAVRYRSKDLPLTVDVFAEEADEGFHIFVRDNGVGIDKENHRKIFAAYTRCNSEVPGLGLGLALCRRTLELAGGGISVHSSLGNGSTFQINLLKP